MNTTQPKRYIGSYQIIDALGEGSFGSVYRAYQPFLDRQVAIKILHDNFFDRAPSEKLFIKEGRTIAKLRHPNIVNVYEFGVVQDAVTNQPSAFMVMEYLPGSTLQTRLKAGLLPIDEVVRLIEQIAQGLAYAHAQNVIHRDLKPANILFTDTNQPVIVDFGLARMAEDKTAEVLLELDKPMAADSTRSTGYTTLGSMGTPKYMAPEQLIGTLVSPATDQYALGLIAFEMLSGYVPFDSDSVTELMVRRAAEKAPSILSRRPQLPAALEAVMDRVLALAPADRFENVSLFAQAFGEALLPNYRAKPTLQIIDPLYVARLQTAQQYVSGFLAILGLFTVIVILFCAAEFVRGYQAGSSPEFLWDGLIVSNTRLPDGLRAVNGIMPGSAAQSAGYQIGDEIQDDLILDNSNPNGAYQVNGVARSTLNIDWQPKPGSQIERPVQRGTAMIQLDYTLQRSTYSLFTLAATLIASFIGVLCGFWMLRRWGAEPGIQVYVPLTFFFSLFIVARAVANLILYFDTLTYHLCLAVLLHIILVFPEPATWVKQHPHRIWWIYAPVTVGIYYLLTRTPIILPIIHLPLQALDYVVYALAIIISLIIKWIRYDIKKYPDVHWLIYGLGFAMALSVYYVVVFYVLPAQVLNDVLGGATFQTVVNDIVLVLLQSFLPILIAVGVHRIQKQLGTTSSHFVVVPANP